MPGRRPRRQIRIAMRVATRSIFPHISGSDPRTLFWKLAREVGLGQADSEKTRTDGHLRVCCWENQFQMVRRRLCRAFESDCRESIRSQCTIASRGASSAEGERLTR